MGLQVKLSVFEKSASAVYVYDCTGVYDSSNTGGFGSPNPKIDDVQARRLLVKGPGQDDYKTIDLSSDFPNTDEVPYLLTPQNAGYSTDYFPSGKYQFRLEYDVMIKGALKTKTGYLVTVLTKDIECCIASKAPIVNENIIIDEAQQEVVLLSNLLEFAKAKASNSLYDSADKDIEYLNGQCKCTTC